MARQQVVDTTRANTDLDNTIYRTWNNQRSQLAGTDEITVFDRDWVKNQVMVPASSLTYDVRRKIFASNAHYKFSDTSLGGNETVNPRPQYTRYADTRADEMLRTITSEVKWDGDSCKQVSIYDNTYLHGMGRYYSESIDDHRQTVMLQFGLPRYNGILEYLRNSVNYVDLYIAKHNRYPKIYEFTRTVTKFVYCIAFPVTNLLVFGIQVLLQEFIGKKALKYYYMEPNMDLYWTSVTNILNQMMVYTGVLTPINVAETKNDALAQKILINKSFKFASEDMRMINHAFGQKLIDESSGYIDIYQAVSRYQVRIGYMYQAVEKSQLLKKMSKYKSIDANGRVNMVDDAYDADFYMTASEYTALYQTIVKEGVGGFWNKLNNLTWSLQNDMKVVKDQYKDLKPEESKIKSQSSDSSSTNTDTGVGTSGYDENGEIYE